MTLLSDPYRRCIHAAEKLSFDPDLFTRRHNPSLPPDARTSDESDEERLLYNLKRLARRGLWGEAADLCRSSGQPWRAASINGRQMLAADGGNTQWLLWLKSCSLIAAKSRLPDERWLYSALSGKPTEDLLLLESCDDKPQDWRDVLWALLQCRKTHLERSNFEQCNSYLASRQSREASKISHLAPDILDSSWQARLASLDSVFETLEKRCGDVLFRGASGRTGPPMHAARRNLPGGSLDTSSLVLYEGDDVELPRPAEGASTSRRKHYALQWFKTCRALILGDYETLIDESVGFAQFVPAALRSIVVHLLCYLKEFVPATPRLESALSRRNQHSLVAKCCTMLPSDIRGAHPTLLTFSAQSCRHPSTQSGASKGRRQCVF